MKIYVFSLRKIAFMVVLLIAGIAFLCLAIYGGKNVAAVFTAQERELPIYYVDSSDKKIAITFDCAWGADDIPSILDTLKAENVKASFFLVGQWAEKFPDSVRMMAQRGHDIANHSYSHLRMDSIPVEKIKSEISECETVLENLTGKKGDLFRPPYGAYNNSTVRAARDMGYYTIQWDVDSLDWKPGITPAEMMNRISGRVKNGSILLFHNDTEHTAKTLPNIIKSLKKQGYSFVPVSQLIIRENYEIDHDGRQKNKE